MKQRKVFIFFMLKNLGDKVYKELFLKGEIFNKNKEVELCCFKIFKG